MKELDKQIEMDAIKKANDAVNEVRREREIERNLRDKEKEYNNIVNAMASLLIDNNENVLGKEITEKAKDKISNENTRNKKDNTKEAISNDQEKVKKTRNARKSA